MAWSMEMPVESGTRGDRFYTAPYAAPLATTRYRRAKEDAVSFPRPDHGERVRERGLHASPSQLAIAQLQKHRLVVGCTCIGVDLNIDNATGKIGADKTEVVAGRT